MTAPTSGERTPSNTPDPSEQTAVQGGDTPLQPETTARVSSGDYAPLDNLLDTPAEVAPTPVKPGLHLSKRAIAALALVATAGVGGLIVVETSGGGSSPHPAAVGTPNPGAPETPTAPVNSPVSSQTPNSAPSSTESLPYGGSDPTLGGPYYSAKTYDPTVAIAVPYVAGQLPDKAVVESLYRDVDVATNLNDLEQLRYAGIYPSSEYAQNLQAGQMASYQSNRQQASALTHVFTQTLDDRDIRFDASNPYHAEVLVRSASDFDLKYAPNRVSYQSVQLELGHRVMQLPNGQTEDIWNIEHATPTPSTFDQWLTGFPS